MPWRPSRLSIVEDCRGDRDGEVDECSESDRISPTLGHGESRDHTSRGGVWDEVASLIRIRTRRRAGRRCATYTTVEGGIGLSNNEAGLRDQAVWGGLCGPLSPRGVRRPRERCGSAFHRFVTYTVVLNKQPTGDVTVTSDATAVATVDPATLRFTTADWDQAQEVTVTGVDDSGVNDPARTATITHAVSGSRRRTPRIARLPPTGGTRMRTSARNLRHGRRGRGVWRGEVVPPWDWRKGKGLGGTRSTAGQQSGGRCNIKGNIGKNGTHIYHVPGGRYYDQTRISTSKGERWFCTEGEARAAGWRRSRQ